MKTIQKDLKSNDLSLNEAIDMAQNNCCNAVEMPLKPSDGGHEILHGECNF